MRLRRGLRVVAGAIVLLAVAAAVPIVAIELACRGDGSASSPERPSLLVQLGRADAARAEARSYLSYPEWYIVHAYEDFAAHLGSADESGFGYLASIAGFWRSLCGIHRLTTARGPVPADMKVMLYTIGLSFTVELAVKGAYETTIGRIAEWSRGPERTEEDRFALAVAQDYARFLRQTPWYEYPFASRIGSLWNDVPVQGKHWLRKWERRLALTAEWGTKAAYAAAIGVASATTLGPADLLIVSVLEVPQGVQLDPRAEILEQLDETHVLVRTPRYRAFTEILVDLAGKGGAPIEIAGNDRALATVLIGDGEAVELAGGRELFAIGLQSEPGTRRIGVDLPVAQLGTLIRQLGATGGRFEHLYDY